MSIAYISSWESPDTRDCRGFLFLKTGQAPREGRGIVAPATETSIPAHPPTFQLNLVRTRTKLTIRQVGCSRLTIADSESTTTSARSNALSIRKALTYKRGVGASLFLNSTCEEAPAGWTRGLLALSAKNRRRGGEGRACLQSQSSAGF